jgi:osmotically-inducible protein OsmY
MNDEELKYFVEGAIDSDPSIPPNSNIGVDVNNGIVTLTGTVPNKRIKHAVGDDAWWLPQVVDVHNEIMVTPRRERVGQTTTQPTSGTSARRGAGGQSR